MPVSDNIMYIRNVSFLKSSIFTCKKNVADYIISRNIPLLGRNNEDYYFADTELLQEIIKYFQNNIKEGVKT